MPDLLASLHYSGKVPRHGEYVGWEDHGEGDAHADNKNRAELQDRREVRRCCVRDARRAANSGQCQYESKFSLASTGFELRRAQFYDFQTATDDQVLFKTYIPHIQQLVRKAVEEYLEEAYAKKLNREDTKPNIVGIWVWDLARRSSLLKNELQEAVTSAMKGEEGEKKQSQVQIDSLAPVPLVHADNYFAESALQRLRQRVMNENGDTLAPGGPLSFRSFLDGQTDNSSSNPSPLTRDRVLRDYCGVDSTLDVSGSGDASCGHPPSKKFLGLNVWRSTDLLNPVKLNPLALCVPSTVDSHRSSHCNENNEGDRHGPHQPSPKIVPFEINCPDVVHVEAHIEVDDSSPDDIKAHDWVYFPEMTSEETLLFFTHNPDVCPTGVWHTALGSDVQEMVAGLEGCEAGDARAGRVDELPHRQSVETRVFVLLDR